MDLDKKAKEILNNKINEHKHRLADTLFGSTEDMVLDAIKLALTIPAAVVSEAVCEHKDWRCDESGVDMFCTKCKDSEVELCDNPHCEDGIVDYDYYKNPIACQVCNNHN